MAEIKIWAPTTPEITVADVLEVEGANYKKRPPNPNMLALRQQFLEQTREKAKIMAVSCQVDIIGTTGDQLHLAGGYHLTSKLLTEVAKTAEKLLLFIMTLGASFDEHVEAANKAGKNMSTFVLDAIGTTYISKAATVELAKIKEEYKKTGKQTTFPLGPGHSYWKNLNDLEVIFQILKAEKIGVSLNQYNLLIPRKSIAFVMGVGHQLPDFTGKNHCDFCSLKKKCHLSSCS